MSSSHLCSFIQTMLAVCPLDSQLIGDGRPDPVLCCRALQEFQDVALAKQTAKLDKTQERVAVAADKVPLVVRRLVMGKESGTG